MPSATPSPSKQPRVHQVQTPEPSLPEWDASHGSVVAARPHSRVTKSLSPQRGRSTATGSRPVTRERPASVAHGDSSGLPSLERQSRPVTRESNGSVSRPGTRGGDQPREHNNLFSDGHLKLRAREKIYNVNLVSRGMPSYEPLLDGYLQDHFATPSIRAHLKRLGIIDSDGYIIDEREFQHMQLAMDRAEKAIQLERESQQRDLDREVEVVVRHAQDPLETQAPPRDHANEEWSAVVEKYTRSLLPPVTGQNRRISALNDGKQLRPRTQESHHRQEEQGTSKSQGKQQTSPPQVSPPVRERQESSPEYEDDFNNDSSTNLAKDNIESQPPNEKPKDVPPAIAPAKADNNSDPPIESVPEPTTTAAKPTAAQPKSIKPAKQSRASSKPKPAEQLPPKPKEPTEGDVRLYQTRLDAIAPNDLVVDNASQTHIAAKELCEQIGSSFTAPVIDASMPLRKVLAEAALLRARAAYLSGKLDDCDAATEVVFRNSPGIPSVQMDLVLFKYHMLMQKGQNDAQPTDRPGEKSACPREIEPATSASRHLATVEPSKTPLENAQDLTVTERVLVEQVSALGGDVDFAIEKIRSTRNLAQSNSEITHATIEPESPSEAANTDREPQARSSCSYLVKSSQPNLGTSSQENFARSSQGNLARSSQPNFAKKSQDTLQKVGHPSSASASRSKLSTSSPEPTSNNVSSAVGLVGGSIDASKTVLASEPNSDAPGETSVEPVLADVAVQPLSQVSAEPALPSPISAEAEYTDDFDDRNPRSVSNPVATEIPLAKSVSGSANALAGNQSQSSHTLSSKHRLNDDKRSAEKLSTESGVASLQESEASVDPAALPLPASVATSRQLLTSGSEDSSTPAPVDPSTVPLPASVAASQVLIPSSLSTHHESSVQPEDIPLPLSVAGSTLLLNSQQSPKPGQRSRSRQNLTNANKGSKSYLASGPKAATGSRQSLRQLDPANIPLPASTANSTLLLNQAGKSGSQVVRPSSSGASSSSKRAKGSQKLHGSTSSLRNRPEKSLTALVDKDSQSMSKSQPLRNGSQRIRSVGDEDRMDQLSGGREVSQNEAAALPLPASRAESKMWLS